LGNLQQLVALANGLARSAPRTTRPKARRPLLPPPACHAAPGQRLLGAGMPFPAQIDPALHPNTKPSVHCSTIHQCPFGQEGHSVSAIPAEILVNPAVTTKPNGHSLARKFLCGQQTLQSGCRESPLLLRHPLPGGGFIACCVYQTPTASLSLPSNTAHRLELCRDITALFFSFCTLLHHSQWQRASSLPPQNSRPAPSRAHQRKHLAPLQVTHVSQMHCYSVQCGT
jgi:hypothetical protein